MLFALLLQTAAPSHAPPLWQLLLAGVGGVVAKYALDRLEEWRQGRKETKRKKSDLQYLSAKTIEVARYAQHMRDTLCCDHISVYAAANGEYLKSGDSIEKMIMQAEAMPRGEPSYIDKHRIIYATDIPHLISQMWVAEYVLMWPEKCDDPKANQIMLRRGYSSSIAMLITLPAPHGRYVLGMVVANWKQLTLHPVRGQAGKNELSVTLKMQQELRRFRVELADLLDNKVD